LAIEHKGNTLIHPESNLHIDKKDERILIGTYDAESNFLTEFPA